MRRDIRKLIESDRFTIVNEFDNFVVCNERSKIKEKILSGELIADKIRPSDEYKNWALVYLNIEKIKGAIYDTTTGEKDI